MLRTRSCKGVGLCRRRHADVVEWAWFSNSYGDDGVYAQLMNGDKDSFLLAFVLANKTSEYYQVSAFVAGLPEARLRSCQVTNLGYRTCNACGNGKMLCLAWLHCAERDKMCKKAACIRFGKASNAPFRIGLCMSMCTGPPSAPGVETF